MLNGGVHRQMRTNILHVPQPKSMQRPCLSNPTVVQSSSCPLRAGLAERDLTGDLGPGLTDRLASGDAVRRVSGDRNGEPDLDLERSRERSLSLFGDLDLLFRRS